VAGQWRHQLRWWRCEPTYGIPHRIVGTLTEPAGRTVAAVRSGYAREGVAWPRALLMVVLLLTTCQSAWATPGLEAMVIDPSHLVPGIARTQVRDVAAKDLYPADTTIGDVQRANVRSGSVVRFDRSSLRLDIAIVEFRTHSWAADRSRLPEEITAWGPSDWRISTVQDGRSWEIRFGSKGRLAFSVWLSRPGKTVDSELGGLADQVFEQQRTAMPTLPDLPNDPASPTRKVGGDFARAVGARIPAIILLATVLGLLAAVARDRGARETAFHLRRRAVPAAEGGVPPVLIDVTAATRSDRRWRTGVTLLRNGTVGALGGLLFAWPGLSLTWTAMGVLTACVAFGFLSELGGGRGLVPPNLYPQARLLLGLGKGLSWAMAAGGLAFIVIATAAFEMVGSVRNISINGWRILVPMAFMGLSVVSGSSRPIRLARRLIQPWVTQRLDNDGRRPVLLLRSFADDSLEVQPPRRMTHGLESLAGEPYIRFEELVAWKAQGFGPLIAIGQPGTVLQPLGAARYYFSDDDWQTAIEERAHTCLSVFMVVGRSPGLIWEISHLRATERLAKAVFIFPPVPESELIARAEVLASALSLGPHALLVPDRRLWPIALTFSDDGIPMLVVSRGRSSDAYLRGLEALSAHISKDHGRLAGPATEHQRVSVVDRSLLTKFDPQAVRKAKKAFVSRMSDVFLYLIP